VRIPQAVHTILLHASLSFPGFLRWEEPMLQALPYARRLELERRTNEARRASLCAIALAVLGASRVAPPGALVRQFVFVPGAKPELHDGPKFSVSHAPEHVACIISDTVAPGLDIEPWRPHDSSPDRQRLRRWTATEAVLKAAGLGLREVGQVRVAEDLSAAQVGAARYLLQEVRSIPHHACHVASAEPCVFAVEAIDLRSNALAAVVERSLGLAVQVE
jgi:phosphopantetheinyl transferase